MKKVLSLEGRAGGALASGVTADAVVLGFVQSGRVSGFFETHYSADFLGEVAIVLATNASITSSSAVTPETVDDFTKNAVAQLWNGMFVQTVKNELVRQVIQPFLREGVSGESLTGVSAILLAPILLENWIYQYCWEAFNRAASPVVAARLTDGEKWV